MANGAPQNYANHRRNDYGLYAALLAVLIAVLLAVIDFVRGPSLLGLAVMMIGVALALVGVRVRTYSIMVQNRVVRLETRLRLTKVLAPELAAKVDQLTHAQLVGLRFASDAELPELVTKVLAEKIEKSDDIKKLVRDWQPDTMRV